MQKQSVMATYKINEAKRVILSEILGEVANLFFLTDLPSGLREQKLAEASVLLTWNPAQELGPSEFGLLKKTRLVQLLSAGVDHVPFNSLPQDIVVAGNVGAYAEPMAEHVLAMTLSLAKNLVREHQKLAQGEFNQLRINRTLRGSTCGILGFGEIGRAVARLMRGLGLRIYAVNTSGKTDEPVDFIGTLKDLRLVLSASDVLVISLPLTNTTRGLIKKQELELMKPDCLLINVARGDIIDQDALYDHLFNHPDFRAGIDAWWREPLRHGEFRTKHPFFTLPNLIGSPHNSAMVPGTSDEAARRAARNIRRFLLGEPLLGCIQRKDYI